MNYYIQGSPARAEEIKAAFEKLGLNVCGHRFMDESTLYYTHPDYGYVLYVKCGNGFDSIIKTHPDYKELQLPKPHYDIANFKVGMPVLVRIDNSCIWSYTLFSHYNNGWAYPFSVASCCSVKQCIPYNNDTKHLLGTTDMCPEEYINW